MQKVTVNKVLPYSVVDGPGNRAAVFLQGCNIACAYCHNPETQQLCNGCGACIGVCPTGALSLRDGKIQWDESICAQCDTCVQTCENHASPKVLHLDAEEVFHRISRSLPFIRGITVSGGECTLFPQFLTELFTLCKTKGLHCLIDSNGMTDFAKLPGLLSVCDGVMLDVKAWNGAVYKRLTGGDNDVVKRNLSFLYDNGKLFEVRIVCLPGEVDAEVVLQGIRDTLGCRSIAALPLKLIRFRRYGVRGRLQSMSAPEELVMKGYAHEAKALGFGNVLIL